MTSRSYLVSGAGSGMGRAIAMQLAQADASNRIVLLGRNADRLESVRRELPNPDQHRVVAADLCNLMELSDALRAAKLESSNLVAVIANAGVGGPNQYGPNDRWDEVIQTNLSGTYHLVQQCMPALRASKETYRHVVVISSVLARLGVPNYSAYCASKAGLLGLTRSWATEYAAEKILVNAICPGWVETEMARQGLEGIASATGRSLAEVSAIEMGRVPTGKMSAPSEVAALVQFLVGGAQCSITGQTLDINNGAVMA